MHEILKVYTKDFNLTGDLLHDINRFFTLNNDIRTLLHTLDVAAEAKRVSELYDLEPVKAVNAALLHDISNVIPISDMLNVANDLSIDIIEEEYRFDRSVHQKLSKYMAQDIFEISDVAILSAIESHTTHKANASMIDKILFVSDKISWKLPGEHLYLQEMRTKVNELEIDEAIFIYVNNIWSQRDKLKLVHPWLIEAREELILKYRM